MSEFEDKTLKCGDCKADFLWTAGEQSFYAERQFTPPRRCKVCRDRRKQDKTAQGS